MLPAPQKALAMVPGRHEALAFELESKEGVVERLEGFRAKLQKNKDRLVEMHAKPEVEVSKRSIERVDTMLNNLEAQLDRELVSNENDEL